jgi:UDP:flavonoid glycosyltransferase YjiC (YdhE family)
LYLHFGFIKGRKLVREGNRVAELGAGVKLEGNRPKYLAKAVADVLEYLTYLENAQKLSEDFRNADGAVEAAGVILAKIVEQS